MHNPLSRCLIVLPFGLPFSWSADYERATASYLSRQNTVIAYLPHEGTPLSRWIRNPHRVLSRHGNFYTYRPVYLIPFQRVPFVALVNYRIATIVLHWLIRFFVRGTYRRLVYWTFSLQYSVPPSWFPDTYFKIYDCIDTLPSTTSDSDKKYAEAEQQVLSHSHIVLVNSDTLSRRLANRHPHTYRVPEGLFVPPDRPNLSEPVDLSGLPHPRVLFLGNINARLDAASIEHMVTTLPHASFVFVGSIDTRYDRLHANTFLRWVGELKKRNNAYFLGEKPKQDVYAYIAHSDAGIIPYDVKQAFVKLSYPMKLFEFFYMGKPVVSAAIEEVKRHVPLVSIYQTPADASRKLRSLLSARHSASRMAKQKQTALKHSLASKMRRVQNVLTTHFPDYF